MDFQKKIKIWAKLDPENLKDFVNDYYKIIFNITSKRIKNIQDTEDTVQDIFVKFIQNNLFKKFKGNTEYEFLAFLTKVSINHIYNYLSGQKNKNAKQININIIDNENLLSILIQSRRDFDPVNEIEEAELMKTLEKEISLLPLNYRDIINLKLLSYTHKEIAEILQIPVGTVDTHTTKILKLLHHSLKKLQVKLD